VRPLDTPQIEELRDTFGLDLPPREQGRAVSGHTSLFARGVALVGDAAVAWRRPDARAPHRGRRWAARQQIHRRGRRAPCPPSRCPPRAAGRRGRHRSRHRASR
jgi:hypothetical protein